MPSGTVRGSSRGLLSGDGGCCRAAGVKALLGTILVKRGDALAVLALLIVAGASTGPTASDPVHVAVPADERHYPGLVAVINSARAHTRRPGALVFHVIVRQGGEVAAHAFLRCRGLSLSDANVRVHGFDASRVRSLVRIHGTPGQANLSSALNFARFYLPELLGSVSSVVYLDADVVVLGDIVALAQRVFPALQPDELAAAVERRHDGLRRHTFGALANASALYEQRYRRRFNQSRYSFNAGVFLLDLEKWSALGLTQEAEWWLAAHARSDVPLWRLGSQPPLNLLLYDRWRRLPRTWNVDGLGWHKHMDPHAVSRAQILHWTGAHKPWAPRGAFNQRLWLPFAGLSPCDGRGECRAQADPARPPCRCAPLDRHPLCDRADPLSDAELRARALRRPTQPLKPARNATAGALPQRRHGLSLRQAVASFARGCALGGVGFAIMWGAFRCCWLPSRRLARR